MPINPWRISQNKIERLTPDEHGRELVLQEARPNSIFPITIEAGDLFENFGEQFFCVRTQVAHLFPRAFDLNGLLDECANGLNFFPLDYLAGKTERSFRGVDSPIRYLRVCKEFFGVFAWCDDRIAKVNWNFDSRRVPD